MNNDQFEQDIKTVIRYLEKNDPQNATREKAISMLNNMESTAHILAHKIVDDEKKGKIKLDNPKN